MSAPVLQGSVGRRGFGTGVARPPDDAGQAVPFVAVVVVLAGLIGIGAVHLGVGEIARARAQAGADAAALAGAAHDRAAAEALARADGAALVSFERIGTDVLVTVEVDGRWASARARAVRTGGDGPGGARQAPRRGS